MSAASAIGRVLRQPPGVWRDVAHAQLMLIVAQLLVWSRPIGELVAADAGEMPGVARSHPKPPLDAKAMRYARAVRVASAYGMFRPKCLVRAVATERMVRGAGITGSRIRIGVRVDDGGFAAHAWVELDGRVLGDRQDYTRQFAPITNVRVL
ncbi:MAG: lasso peptide biosynthesis B2 protein [Gemmatimonadaceae bacterium]|nr:lasso peptide biosynthesis B2 protein [Gemmatimonadaceae bacterium]NUQ91473.1 lasso peptide biosynthesis B2 protein [Gemmatimonadaceae bacterium]NUR20311.1 lasso peptide biosynthesis B2 protein [Gemmatimonadaceae bacterium]NUS96292.1 lasso peptide biosynthesis B2 protein [Gemmatimonadaceae bacterium]